MEDALGSSIVLSSVFTQNLTLSGKPAFRRGQPTRKDQRKFARMEKKQSRSQHYASSRIPDDEVEAEAAQLDRHPRKRKAEETHGLSRDEKSEGANGSPATQKKKKKKSELRLPQETAADAEDGEIEWLEYMLKKERRRSRTRTVWTTD